MANLDYTLIAKELESLAGRFFDKFYEQKKGVFRLKFGRDNVLIELPLRLHKTKYIVPAPEASSFAMKIRKHLKGKKLRSVFQHKRDRVIVFDFEGILLIAEMFGKGNLVLVSDGKILAVYSREKWKDRLLLSGQEYKFPISETKDLAEIFELKNQKALAAELRALDIGMSYVRAMLKDAGVEESKPISDLTEDEKERIEHSYAKLLENPKEFSGFGSGSGTETFSEILDQYYGAPEIKQEAKIEKNKELKKLKRLLESQEKRLSELILAEEDARKKAEYLYAHYEDVEVILSLYKKGGLPAIEKLAKEKGWKVDKKEKVLEI